MKRKNQILSIIFLSSFLGLIRFSIMDNSDFELIKKEKIIQEITTFTIPENMTEPMAISLDFAKYLFDNKLAVFIDARDVEDYDSGHIQNSINIPFDDYENYENEIDSLNSEDTYIIYCNGEECSLSLDLAEYFFNEMLFEKVLIFEGGWPVWLDMEYPQ